MRRFGGWIFNGLAVLSLVLCLATVVLWIRSAFCEDVWLPPSGLFVHRVFHSQGGAVELDDYWWADRQHVYNPRPVFFMPYFVPAIALGLLPGCWLAKRMLRPKGSDGAHCLSCGYNLTGNVSGVCPECGAQIPSKA
jgi:hypothetical protein